MDTAAGALHDTLNKRRIEQVKSSTDATDTSDGGENEEWDMPPPPDKASNADIVYTKTLFNTITSSQAYKKSDTEDENNIIHNVLKDVEPLLLKPKTEANIYKARLLLEDLKKSLYLTDNLLDLPQYAPDADYSAVKEPLFQKDHDAFISFVEDYIYKSRYDDAKKQLQLALTYRPKDFTYNNLLNAVNQLAINDFNTVSSV